MSTYYKMLETADETSSLHILKTLNQTFSCGFHKNLIFEEQCIKET